MAGPLRGPFLFVEIAYLCLMARYNPGFFRPIHPKPSAAFTKLMKALHAAYVANSLYANHLEGQIARIREEEADKVNAHYMLSTYGGELYAIVPVVYYTKYPTLAFSPSPVPKKYKSLYFICNYSKIGYSKNSLQQTFLFADAEVYAEAFAQAQNAFQHMTQMAAAKKEEYTLIPADAITAFFCIYESMALDVPEPIRHAEYATLELSKASIEEIIDWMERR